MDQNCKVSGSSSCSERGERQPQAAGGEEGGEAELPALLPSLASLWH